MYARCDWDYRRQKGEINVIYYTRYPTEQMNSNESKCNYSDKTKTSKLSFTNLSVETLGA